MCLGRRKVRHFCKTTTSHIIGAAAAAPAVPLSTPLQDRLICLTPVDNKKKQVFE